MDELTEVVDGVAAEIGLSGAVRVDVGGAIACNRAFGLANRALGVPNTVDTRFADASGTKGLTALTVMSLVETGELEMSTTARSLLGADLPSIDDTVTVEQLLGHRSGIGDYLDESIEHEPDAYLMPVPVHELATTQQFVSILDHPMKWAPGTRFDYCNAGYVVLALLAERAADVPFHDLVERRVLDPAGLTDTRFLRSDELPSRTALGYLHDDGLRTNVFHLPVRGNGNGDVYTTLADVHRFWAALFDSRIVGRSTVERMTSVVSAPDGETLQYGLGFWLDTERGAVGLVGSDQGVSFGSFTQRATGTTYTVLSNTGGGAWPVLRAIRRHLDGLI